MSHARSLGALCISISCVPSIEAELPSHIDIRLITGPELLTGSTRLKAGTATKMTLNMISTISMVKLGKVYGNKMIDLSVTNSKLLDRGIRILKDLAHVDNNRAIELLNIAKGSVKISILMALTDLGLQQTKDLLDSNQGNLREALKSFRLEKE